MGIECVGIFDKEAAALCDLKSILIEFYSRILMGEENSNL
jgi:hypothetical protein